MKKEIREFLRMNFEIVVGLDLSSSYWQHIEESFDAASDFRFETIEKWNQKTQLATGSHHIFFTCHQSFMYLLFILGNQAMLGKRFKALNQVSCLN